ncbi:MAG TPA: response regulator transcription factor [Saprospiraceae bacterium]|nr:response regulator transcription factor [Saprospiraceae bacterium]
MKAHLLYIEDDESLSFVTRDNLELEGYKVTWCKDGKEALEKIDKEHFDLYILDVMLPEMDGFSLAQRIREYDTQVPILFVTAKSLKEDRLHGLRIGGDDYITKPFSIEELILKIEIFLKRRLIVQAESPKVQELGIFEFDHHNLVLCSPEGERILTQKEADLLNYFLRHKNQLVRRSAILKTIWGQDDYFLGRSLDVFISRLRKYLRAEKRIKIENVHGIGFRFLVNE